MALEPSFDCQQASGEVESIICEDGELAALDLKLSDLWKTVAQQEQTLAAKGEKAIVNQWQATQRGWIKGRNDCWKAEDIKACVQTAYEDRLSTLEVLYSLAPLVNAVTYACDGEPPRRISASFYNSLKPGVRLERGEEVTVGLLQVSGSGARYVADFGVQFWIKGDNALVSWPQGTEFSCHVLDEG
ncbi:MliC family protein [Pseudovibrio sp. SPO723]|nr:MliC family protein [Pseudovibrio sp. SPO723]MDX5594387.1 MliC family protein [Pseudovibrio sp. SPO723]